jgi:hypothetical protein
MHRLYLVHKTLMFPRIRRKKILTNTLSVRMLVAAETFEIVQPIYKHRTSPKISERGRQSVQELFHSVTHEVSLTSDTFLIFASTFRRVLGNYVPSLED